jgi:hypothetical protein
MLIHLLTNFRIYNFYQNPSSHLKYLSLFEVEEKVDNITPMTAVTNAKAAGIMVT